MAKITANSVMAVARSQVGYIGKKYATDNLDIFEAPNGSGEYTKYARDMANAGFYNFSKQGYDGWCTVGSDWCFYKAAGSKEEADRVNPIGELGASADWAYKDYQNAKLIVDVPEVGDRVFFLNNKGAAVHVGLVDWVDTNTKAINTLEFNGNGNVVYIRERNYGDGSINVKFGRPRYDSEEPIPELNVGDKIMIKEGAKVYGKDYEFSSWVYKTVMYVRAIAGDKVTFSTQMTGATTGSVAITDVIPIDIPEPEPEPEPDTVTLTREQFNEIIEAVENAKDILDKTLGFLKNF